MKQHSQNLNRVVRLHSAREGTAVRVVVSDDLGIARTNLAQAASPDLSDLHLRSEPTPMVMEADGLSAPSWSVFTFFMEGFAAYAVSLYPTPASVEVVLTAAKAPEPGSATPWLTATEYESRTYLLIENNNVIELGRVPTRGGGRSSRWNWLTSSLQTVAILWRHWRREQEIRRAVVALAKLDDRTLQDIGIPHRSQIDQAVRYHRDC